MRTIRIIAAGLLLLLSSAVFAATYIVPADRDMIQGSDDIVIATGVTSLVERNERDGIVTRYTLRIEETLKGEREPGEHLVLTEVGGSIDDTFIYSPGTPEYETGQRYIVFTETDPDGEPITYGLSLGQFKLVEDRSHLLAIRYGISGLDQNLQSRPERIRDARLFIDYIRGIVEGRVAVEPAYFVATSSPASTASRRWQPKSLFSRTSYLSGSYRWQIPTYSFTKSGSQPGANGPGSVSTADSLWSGTTSVINLIDGPQDDAESCSLCDGVFDGVNVVQFNRPGLPSGVAGRAWFGGSGTHTVPGDPDTFNNISEVDVHIDDVSFSQCVLDIVVTHEIGHTLGFRHSDAPPPGGESTTNAFMNSIVSCALYGDGSLKQYDEDAAATVYGAGSPVTAPTGVTATATSTSNVNVAWNTSVGALSYNVYRFSLGLGYQLAGSTVAPATTFNDGGRSANTSYLYKVRAVNGGESGDSNIDLATTVIFTDDPLVVGTTLVKSTHITQLRTAINAVRTLASLGGGSYTDPTLTAGVTLSKAVHVNDLRTAINAARSALTLSALSYGETITASATTVKASHLTELRNGVK